MSVTKDNSEIKEFYCGTNIFITGGTGFLGKLIIEKLLRSCPGIKKIYILCRPKKEKEIKIRLTEQFDSILYDILRKMDPQFKSKIVPIQGDCAESNLGINDEDMETLVNEVNIIFHCAATVRFDEPLCKAVRINVQSIQNLLSLAHGMKHLKALVHMSTAYSNCVYDYIDEKFYDPPFNSDLLVRIMEAVDEDTFNRITPGLMGKYPNTYTFSKAVAEDVVKQNSKGLPVCIIRPAIVTSTYKEPVAGRCENITGLAGAAAGILLGILHTWCGDANKIAAVVPADYVVNATIVAAWDIAQIWRRHRQNVIIDTNNLGCLNDIPIYNYAGCLERPLTWGEFMRGGVEWCRSLPTLKCLWVYFVIMTKYKSVDFVCRCLFHFLPAYVIESIMFLTGKHSSHVKQYKLLHKMIDVVSPFVFNEWKFENRNTQNLYGKLNDTDKMLFNFDMSKMNWAEYLESYVTGLRVYTLKDPLTTVPEARKRYKILKLLNMILLIILIFSFCLIWIDVCFKSI